MLGIAITFQAEQISPRLFDAKVVVIATVLKGDIKKSFENLEVRKRELRAAPPHPLVLQVFSIEIVELQFQLCALITTPRKVRARENFGSKKIYGILIIVYDIA